MLKKTGKVSCFFCPGLRPIAWGAATAFLLFPLCGSGQEIKTVAQCRAYREAWITSANDDIDKLTVRTLIQRAEQMLTCGREIDKSPIENGKTLSEALDVSILNMGYPILAASYYREAFRRSAWFIDNRKLTDEFIHDDVERKIVKNPKNAHK